MQTIALIYDSGGAVSRDYDIYSIRYEDSEFERVLHHSEVTGQYREHNIGYRLKYDIDFVPLQNNKDALYYLYAWLLSDTKEIKFNDADSGLGDIQVPVVWTGDKATFAYIDNIFFANAFSLSFVDGTLSTVGDDDSTRILIPYYLPDDGADGNYYCNLVNDSDAVFVKRTFKPVGGNRFEKLFSYQHQLDIDIGNVSTLARRVWVREFCLWGSKQIDTTQIDPVNGSVFDVVCLDEGLKWDFNNGLRTDLTTKLSFVEKEPRTDIEAPNDNPFIIDIDQTDYKATGPDPPHF